MSNSTFTSNCTEAPGSRSAVGAGVDAARPQAGQPTGAQVKPVPAPGAGRMVGALALAPAGSNPAMMLKDVQLVNKAVEGLVPEGVTIATAGWMPLSGSGEEMEKHAASVGHALMRDREPPRATLGAPEEASIGKEEHYPTPRLYHVSHAEFLDGAPVVHGSLDQAVRHCGLPAFPNQAAQLPPGGACLPGDAAGVLLVGAGACDVLGRFKLLSTVRLASGVHIAVTLGIKQRHPEHLENLSTCVQVRVVGANGQAGPYGGTLWCAPVAGARHTWVVLAATLMMEPRAMSDQQAGNAVIQCLLGLRANGAITSNGSLLPGPCNILPGASFAAVLAAEARYPTLDADIAGLPMQVFGPKWSRVLAATRISKKVRLGRCSLTGAGKLETRGLVGYGCDLPVSDVLHVGDGTDRVLLAAVRVSTTAGKWAYVAMESGWCNPGVWANTTVPNGTGFKPSEGPIKTSSSGHLLLGGSSQSRGVRTILAKAVQGQRSWAEPICHAYGHDTLELCSHLLSIGTVMHLSMTLLPHSRGVMWFDNRANLSGTICVHYGGAYMPSWLGWVDLEGPMFWQGGLNEPEVKPVPVPWGLASGLDASMASGFAQWVTAPVALQRCDGAELATFVMEPAAGQLAGTKVRCSAMYTSDCASGLGVAYNVSIYYEGHLGGTLSILTPEAKLTAACMRNCACARLSRAIVSSTRSYSGSVGPIWDRVLSGRERHLTLHNHDWLRLSWAGEYTPLDFSLFCGQQVEGGDTKVGAGWDRTLGRGVLAEVEWLLEAFTT
jgi:hypothetical protein